MSIFISDIILPSSNYRKLVRSLRKSQEKENEKTAN